MRADGKPEGLRQSMSWVHTYTGLLMGWLLYAVFFTGTLSYFRNEVNDWMRPELHGSVADEHTAQRALDALQDLAPNAASWTVSLPTARRVAVDASWRELGAPANNRNATKRVTLDAGSGEQLTPRETRASNFFYRFHFELHAMPRTWGRWIVGIATMLMFFAIISGVITHKKIFTDFFTFRPKKGQRSWLDAHNATAVLALPFHIMITFSGLILLAGTLMPWAAQGVYEGGIAPRGARGALAVPQVAPNGGDGTLAAVAPMLAQAQQHWPQHGVGSITVNAPNTTRAVVTLTEGGGFSLINGSRGRTLHFDGNTGDLLDAPAPAPASAVRATRNVFTVLHEGRFAGPLMRWLLFIGGVLGTFMAASGMVLWVVKRLPQRRKQGSTPFSHRLVEILNVGAIGGLSIAMATLFWVNRLLPAQMAGRADWEIRGFFIVWLLCALYALVCSHRKAWLHLMALATLMYGLLPLLNVATGGASLIHSVINGQQSIASVDLILLALAGMHGTVVWWMLRAGKAAKPAAKAVKPAAVKPAAGLRPAPAGAGMAAGVTAGVAVGVASVAAAAPAVAAAATSALEHVS